MSFFIFFSLLVIVPVAFHAAGKPGPSLARGVFLGILLAIGYSVAGNQKNPVGGLFVFVPIFLVLAPWLAGTLIGASAGFLLKFVGRIFGKETAQEAVTPDDATTAITSPHATP